jgi:hypothetical protein
LHASPPVSDAEIAERVDRDFDEPYTFGQVHPTVDRPGPFSLREYVRLALLRSRIHDQRLVRLAYQEPAQVGSTSRR